MNILKIIAPLFLINQKAYYATPSKVFKDTYKTNLDPREFGIRSRVTTTSCFDEETGSRVCSYLFFQCPDQKFFTDPIKNNSMCRYRITNDEAMENQSAPDRPVTERKFTGRGWGDMLPRDNFSWYN